MTHKPIVFPKHAALKMKERHITRQKVREAIYHGDVWHPDAAYGPGRIGRRLRVGQRYLIVIWVEESTTREVVTAMWEQRNKGRP